MQTFKHPTTFPNGGKGAKNMTTLLLCAGLLAASCHTPELLETPTPKTDNPDYLVIHGDTTKPVVLKDYQKLKDKDPNSKNYVFVGDTIIVYKEPKLHTLLTKDPDISNLKNNTDPDLKGKPLRYVAIGGSLAAGVREGGYFNAGMLTSYPNLIARQMKLQKFEQPFFATSDYNGFGRKVRTNYNPTGGPMPKFSIIKNNSGIETFTDADVKLKGYVGKKDNVDNWAFPKLKASQLDLYDANSVIYRNRLSLTGYYYDEIKLQKFDLFTMDFSSEVWEYAINGNVSGLFNDRPRTEHPISLLLKQFASAGRKGCIANVPDPSDFPYFRQTTYSDLSKAALGGKITFYQNTSNSTDLNKILILPTSHIDSLLSPKVNFALKNFKLNSQDANPFNDGVFEFGAKDNNDTYSTWAKDAGYPIVDLHTLYKQIMLGGYITDDGVKIDPSYPNGNFFSTDGIFPTPLGQAVIANEFIRTLNNFYKLSIPLIPTKEYVGQ